MAEERSVLEIKKEMDDLGEHIKELTQELEELEGLYLLKLSEIQANYETKREHLLREKTYLLNHLKTLFALVPFKETKTQRKCELLSCSVILKKPSQKITCDKEKMLEWASAAGKDEFIEKKESLSFKWADFKSHLDVVSVDGEPCIVDRDTGEILTLSGLEIVEIPERVEIK
jgi:phage host-nuclease inhibitor protein Gam